jgi:hypothetical protein
MYTVQYIGKYRKGTNLVTLVTAFFFIFYFRFHKLQYYQHCLVKVRRINATFYRIRPFAVIYKGGTLQLSFEALCYKPEGCGFDSR